MIWEASGLEYGYPGAAENAVGGVHIAVGAGETVAILGPNGSGKTTLLRLLLGALAPASGRVSFDGRPIREWDRVALARRVAVLPQSEEPAFPIRARELVETGRYPHLGRWRPMSRRDGDIVDQALERCRVADFAGREFATLSGGERQRVRLARALAQEPAALALDEPTASLDVAHEMEIWDLMADEARSGRAVLLTTHNLNLAARYADRLILLERGRVAASGRAAEVLTCSTIARVYDWPVAIAPHDGPGPDRNAPQVIPLRRP